MDVEQNGDQTNANQLTKPTTNWSRRSGLFKQIKTNPNLHLFNL
jgi:hypothetical protein